MHLARKICEEDAWKRPWVIFAERALLAWSFSLRMTRLKPADRFIARGSTHGAPCLSLPKLGKRLAALAFTRKHHPPPETGAVASARAFQPCIQKNMLAAHCFSS